MIAPTRPVTKMILVKDTFENECWSFERGHFQERIMGPLGWGFHCECGILYADKRMYGYLKGKNDR